MNNKELAEKIVLWIRDTVLASNCKGVVIGISGGVDSSVLAVLCQRAFPKNTLGVIMPCYNNHTEAEHAQELAKQFSMPTRIVVLDSVFDALLKVLPSNKAEPVIEQVAKELILCHWGAWLKDR